MNNRSLHNLSSKFRRLSMLSFQFLVISACSLVGPIEEKVVIEGIIRPEEPSLLITFPSEMEQVSTIQALSITPDIVFEYDWQGLDLEIRLLELPIPAEIYTVVISDEAKTLEGNVFQPVDLNYMAEDIEASYIALHHDEINATFEISFNYPMNRDTVAESLTVEPQLDFTVAWEDDSNLTIIPETQFVPNTRYQITVNPQAITTKGFSLNTAQSWVFVSEPLRSEFQGVYLRNTTPNILFNYYFNYSIPPNHTRLEVQANPSVDFDIQWTNDFKQLTLTPVSPLASQETYTFDISLSGEEDSPYAEFVYKETSTYATPQISVFLERTDASDRSSPFILTFNYQMNPNLVERAILFSPHVDFDIEWSSNYRSAIVTPRQPFPNGTKNSIRIAPTAADATGNTIVLSREWTFELPNNEIESPELAEEKLIEFMAGNEECELPCIWGITPGKTQFPYAYEVIFPLGFVSTKDLTYDSQIYAVRVKVPSSNSSIAAIEFVERDLDIIEVHTLLKWINYPEETTIHSFLEKHGQPDEILVSTRIFPSETLTRFISTYNRLGLLVWWESLGSKVIDEKYDVCPIKDIFHPPQVLTWSLDHKDGFEDSQLFPELFETPHQQIFSLNPNITVTSFYENTIGRTNECIELSALSSN